jgi:hypothetical protein
LIQNLNQNKKEHALAIALLGEPSEKGYTRMKRQMKDFASLPSYHILSKSRLMIQAIEVEVMQSHDDHNNNDEDDNTGTIVLVMIINGTVLHNTVPLAITTTGNEEADLAVALRTLSQCNNRQKLSGAKIEGDYKVYLQLMEQKHKKKGRIIKNEEQVMVLGSIDGAEHLKLRKSIISVISFSSTIFTPNWINTRIFIFETHPPLLSN